MATTPAIEPFDAKQELINSLSRIVLYNPPVHTCSTEWKRQGILRGPLGVSYLFHKLSAMLPDLLIKGQGMLDWAESYLSLSAIQSSSTVPRDNTSVNKDKCGISNEYLVHLALEAVILNNHGARQVFLDQGRRLIDVFKRAGPGELGSRNIGLFHGLAGYAFLLRFIDEHLVPAEGTDLSDEALGIVQRKITQMRGSIANCLFASWRGIYDKIQSEIKSGQIDTVRESLIDYTSALAEVMLLKETSRQTDSVTKAATLTMCERVADLVYDLYSSSHCLKHHSKARFNDDTSHSNTVPSLKEVEQTALYTDPLDIIISLTLSLKMQTEHIDSPAKDSNTTTVFPPRIKNNLSQAEIQRCLDGVASELKSISFETENEATQSLLTPATRHDQIRLEHSRSPNVYLKAISTSELEKPNNPQMRLAGHSDEYVSLFTGEAARAWVWMRLACKKTS